MKVNDFIKKGSLLTLSTAVLFAPIASTYASSEPYKLNNSVQVYDNAERALKREKSYSTFSKGNYYIIEKKDYVLNISKNPDVTGKWINSKDNLELIENETKKTNIAKDEFRLTSQVSGYMDSNSAKSNTNPVSILYPDKYYIFNEYNGMINISKDKNKAGAWINPSKVVDSNDENNLQTSNLYNLTKNTLGYYNSYNAKNNINSVMDVQKGSYYIYSSHNGMINITKDPKSPGVWINPESEVLNNNVVNTSSNIEDENQSVNTVVEEKVFIQKPDKNIINIDFNQDNNKVILTEESYQETVENTDNVVISSEKIKISNDLESENENESVEEANKDTKNELVEDTDKYTENELVEETIQETERESIEETSNENEKESVVERNSEKNDEDYIETDEIAKIDIKSTKKAYLRLTDAIEERNAISELSSGEYFVYKSENGYLNISKTANEAGMWINSN